MRYILLISGLLILSQAFAQNKLTFKVKEETGEYLIGASIVIEGTTNGTITNADGLASFDDLQDGKYQFVISSVGYEEKEIELIFPDDNNRTIEIELEAGHELEEVLIATTRS